MPNIGGPELIIVLLTVLPFVIAVITLIDLARRPDAQFVAAGQNRTVWLVLAIASAAIPFVWLADLYYLFAIRPKLAARS